MKNGGNLSIRKNFIFRRFFRDKSKGNIQNYLLQLAEVEIRFEKQTEKIFQIFYVMRGSHFTDTRPSSRCFYNLHPIAKKFISNGSLGNKLLFSGSELVVICLVIEKIQ